MQERFIVKFDDAKAAKKKNKLQQFQMTSKR